MTWRDDLITQATTAADVALASRPDHLATCTEHVIGAGLPSIVDAVAERVRELHRRNTYAAVWGMASTFGQTEFPDGCEHCCAVWPCPTVRLLDDISREVRRCAF